MLTEYASYYTKNVSFKEEMLGMDLETCAPSTTTIDKPPCHGSRETIPFKRGHNLSISTCKLIPLGIEDFSR